MKNNKAFTLIELIAVLVIMAILALIVTPLVLNIIRKARISADKRSIDAYGRSIELAIASYLLDEGKLAYKSIFQKTRGTRSELINNFCNMLKINNSIQLDNFFKKKFKKEKNIISNDKLNVINKLKKMGYKIILFSNNCCLLEDYFDEYYGLFDKIFYSFDIGYTKNETESYRYIEKNMGYKPCEFLHIGDTYDCDYICPKENGWNAIYYNKGSVKKIESIKSFIEIIDYLK